MLAPFGQLFLDLQARIKELVPAIAWVDQDLSQLEGYNARPAVSFPCALIDFDGWQYDELGELSQHGFGTVVIRLGFPPYSSTANITPEAYRKKALHYYNIEQALYQALQGWSPGDAWGHLIRTAVDTEKREDALRVRVVQYKLNFEDMSALHELITLPYSDFNDDFEEDAFGGVSPDFEAII